MVSCERIWRVSRGGRLPPAAERQSVRRREQVTLEQLGGLGEFVGALAILVSLVYVAREIRENSRSTRLAALQSAMLADQIVIELPARDRDLARILRIGIGRSEGASTRTNSRNFATGRTSGCVRPRICSSSTRLA